MWRLVLLLSIWAWGAQAQIATVSSGEHDGFTRLVLTFQEPTGWDFGRTGDGYGFRSRQSGLRFDISGVFTRIRRDRLSALWVDPQSGVLRLGLGCDCHAIASPFRPGIVVIDIVNGPAPPGAPHESALANPGGVLPQVLARQGPRPRARPRDFRLPPALPVVTLPERPAPALPPGLTMPMPDARALALQAELTRSLARAVAAGAVEPALDRRFAPERAVASGPRVQPMPQTAENSPPEQLRLVDPREISRGGQASTSGQRCIAPERLDLASWASDAPAAAQFAEARADLLGEFDRPDRDRLIALVRLHLHFGFGVEARRMLELWAPEDPERPVLDALAVLADGAGNPRAFAGMAGCDGPAALWAVLSDPAPRPQGIDQAAVLRAFSDLPTGLRRHLGPDLAERFMAMSDLSTARAIRDAIDRLPAPAAVPAALIAAQIDLADGRAAVAEAGLDALARDNRLLAPRALAALVESQARRGRSPGQDTLLSLEAMLREHLGTGEEVRLRRALAFGLLIDGDHGRALRDLAAQDPEIVPEAWAILAEYGRDAAVAELALAPPDGQLDLLPPATRMAIAGRLIGIGFPDMAAVYLHPVQGPTADLLRARAALANRDGRTALRAIAAQGGEEAESLRAQALELLGDLPGAHAAWRAAGDGARAERALFLAGDWDGLGGTADGELAALLARRGTTPPEEEAKPLADGRLRVAESLAMRDRLRALLDRGPVP